MNYVEHVISNRHKFGIRSVWNSIEYQRMVPSFRQLADCSQHKYVADSLGWGDILSFVKDKVVPFVGAGVKAVAPGLSGVVDTIQRAVANSASGRSIARAADGPIAHCADYPLMNVNGQNHKAVMARRPFVVKRPTIRVKEKVPLLSQKAAMFPTLLEDENKRWVGDGLYVAMRGNHSALLTGSFPTCNTLDGHKVYGLMRSEGVQYPTNGDITLFSIDPALARKGRVKFLPGMPFCTGHSCDGAIWLVANGEFEGLYPVVITGEIALSAGKAVLLLNPVHDLKMKYVHSLGLPFAANASNADIPVTDLAVLRKPPITKTFVLGKPKLSY